MILVVGDLIVDIYHRGRVRGISAETPTMVMLRETREEFQGGAGLVKRHISNHGKDSVLLDGGFVSTKERFFVDGYKLFQVDEVNRTVHIDESRNLLKEEIEKYVCLGCDTVVVCDNGHGVIDYRIAEFISDLKFSLEKPFRLIVNSQSSQHKSRYQWFSGVDLFCMNWKEFIEYHEFKCDCSMIRDEHPRLEYNEICHVAKMAGHDIVVTLGSEGSVACVDQSIYRNKPSVIGDIIDTCGAGDAFISVLASHDWKKNPHETLQFANDYAAFHCALLGTQVKRYEKNH